MLWPRKMANPTAFSFDVFLSHNSKDKARVRRLAERLRGAGVRVWFDAWVIRPGDDVYLSIERGLEAARTLVLCLSPAALGSDWVGLERSTALFRDPSNADRRFIPLLLADCDLPDTIRRYKYVDFREEAEAAFEELLIACRAEETAKPAQKPKPDDSLAVLERKLTGHTDRVFSVAVSPDGKWVASGSGDKTVKIWDIEMGNCHATLQGHGGDVTCVAITPDGRRLLSSSYDRTVRIWAFPSGRLEHVLQGHWDAVRSVAPIAKGELLLSGGGDRSIKLWVTDSGACRKTIPAGQSVWATALSADGKRLLIGGPDGRMELWNLDAGQRLAAMKQHGAFVNSVAITADGRHGFSGSDDETVRIWDLDADTCLGTLEGHGGRVHSVALSPGGTWIASTGFTDDTVRLWDWKSGACLHVVQQDESPISVAFSPNGWHVVVGTLQGSVYIYRLSALLTAPSAELARRYVNAKVVLVGESGVGKSGLAHRLVEDRFVPTASTHGMQVWRLDLPDSPQPDGGYLEREALLWDLAGQEDYRLVHQLFLDETALALVLINPQKGDPFAEVGDWLKAVRAALGAKDPQRDAARILIAARTDVGGIRVGQQKIDRFLKEYGFAAYLATSAMTGENCSDSMNGGKPSALKRLIADLIPWDRQPWTSTPRLLAGIKNSVLEMRERKEIRLLRFAELCQRLERTLTGQPFGEVDVRTALAQLANQGLVMPLRFGDLVLMRPELLNGYAGAVIRAARKHVDEIGCVREQDVFDCKLDFEGVDRLEPADEELLMRAMVQTFLNTSLCIAEDTSQGRHLVFPSQYRRERPFPTHPEVFVSYTFTGGLQMVYTTLVVGLWYSRGFDHKELWLNAAEFLTSKGRTVGLVMQKTGDGQGTINVFFESGVPDELKVAFIEYIHRHLEKCARDVTRDRRYICERCGTPVRDRDLVRKRLAEGKEFVYCPECGKKVPFLDHIEQRLGSDPVARRVLAMEQTDQRERDTQALEQILIGHMMAICGEASQIFRPVTMWDYGIDGEVEFKSDDGQASGRKIYVQLKSGGSYLRARKTDAQEVFDVKNPRHLKFWVNQPVDVYLVVRDAEGTIRWMNVTAYLKARAAKQSRQIVFEGEKLDAPAVWRMRDRVMGR